jgi:hypothetical protein
MTDDEHLAEEFLGGQIRDNGEHWSHQYLEPGSDQEREARQALVRLLRSGLPLSSVIRWRLAALFDPAHTAEAREIEVKPRRGGIQRKPVRDVEIARDVAAEVSEMPGRFEAAVAAAMQRYRVSRATVLRAWAQHKAAWLRSHHRSLN